MSEFSSFPLVLPVTGAITLLLVIFNWLIGDFTLLLCTVVFLISLALEVARLLDSTGAVGSSGMAIGLTSRSSAQCFLCLAFSSFEFDPTFGPHFRPLCLAWLLVLTVLVVFTVLLLDVLFECTGDRPLEIEIVIKSQLI